MVWEILFVLVITCLRDKWDKFPEFTFLKLWNLPSKTREISKFQKMNQPYVTLEIVNPDISGIFWTLKYLKLNTYLDSSQSVMMECFTKIFKSYDYISNVLYPSSLTMFWINLLLNKYSLICRVTSWTDRVTYLGIFMSYSDIFSHIVAYLEPCATFVYSEPCHT